MARLSQAPAIVGVFYIMCVCGVMVVVGGGYFQRTTQDGLRHESARGQGAQRQSPMVVKERPTSHARVLLV